MKFVMSEKGQARSAAVRRIVQFWLAAVASASACHYRQEIYVV